LRDAVVQSLTLPLRQLLPSITADTEPAGSTEAGMAWSIAEVARMSKVTSRTLRHYDDVGLLRPAYVGSNGYRYYEQEQLLRLQRVLLLRELGLGLGAIAEVLAGDRDQVAALRQHERWLHSERDRLGQLVEQVGNRGQQPLALLMAHVPGTEDAHHGGVIGKHACFAVACRRARHVRGAGSSATRCPSGSSPAARSSTRPGGS